MYQVFASRSPDHERDVINLRSLLTSLLRATLWSHPIKDRVKAWFILLTALRLVWIPLGLLDMGLKKRIHKESPSSLWDYVEQDQVVKQSLIKKSHP